MSLITHTELCELVEQGVITNVKPEQINGASVDLTLQDGYLFEQKPKAGYSLINIGKKENLTLRKAYGTLILQPGDFALASTEQVFNLPNDIAAVYVLKSSMARNGLNHLNAGYCDPGWNGSTLTMEFHNLLRYHTLTMAPGDKCGQMYFFRGAAVPELQSYAVRGQYNADSGVQASRGVR